jgi:hypothetical protein
VAAKGKFAERLSDTNFRYPHGNSRFLDLIGSLKHLRVGTVMPLAQSILNQLRQIVGGVNVLTEKEDLIPYSFDGTAAMSQMPGGIAFATTTDQVAAILKLANASKTAIVTRGSGTG